MDGTDAGLVALGQAGRASGEDLRAAFERSLERRPLPERETYRMSKLCIDNWADAGFLPRETYAGKVVLDLECGKGLNAAILRVLGATHVVGSDTFLDRTTPPAHIRDVPGVEFRHGPIASLREEFRGAFDLVFCSTSSEHVRELAGMIDAAAELLRPDGHLFVNHDNYYQPVGHHDHGFLSLDLATARVEFRGVRCWEPADKCVASADHRAQLLRDFPQQWDRRTDDARTPDDCTRCPYWKRAQPWAHLLFADEFLSVFPQEFFRSAGPLGALNKATLFQVRQFIREAGFAIVREGPYDVGNDVPESLERRFVRSDLQALQLTLLARKVRSP